MLAIFAAVMRRNLHETEAFEEAKKMHQADGLDPRTSQISARAAAGGRPHRRQGRAAFYTFTTYMQTFVRLSAGLTEDQTTLVIFGSLIFATLLQPIYGARPTASAASRC